MKFLLLSFLIVLSAESFAQTSYVAPARILAKKASQIGVYGEFFQSSKRIDKDGNKLSFEDGEKFSRMQGEFAGYYGLTENLQLGGGVRFRQNDSVFNNALTSEQESESSVGVQSTFFNAVFAFKPVDRLRYILEGTFRYTPYTNEETSGTNVGKFVLGDDGNEYSAGLGMTYSSLNNNFLSLRTGYRKPGSELSPEIYWQAEGALAWNYVALLAGVDGVSSLNADPYESDPQNKPNFNTGSTALYNSTNREWIAPYVGMNLALGQNWRLEFKGSQVVSGRSTDLGSAFGVALIRRVNDKKTDRADKKFKDYDFEGSITKISPKKGFVVIDKGIADDVQKGMRIDFFEFDYVGGNILLARGTVIQAKANSSIVKITHLYNTKKELKEGVVARGSFR